MNYLGCFLALFLRLSISLGVGMLLAWWLCDISPEKEYTWYSGIWHGIFFIPNYIRSFFVDSLYKAEIYTTAYNVFWWILTILSIMSALFGGSRRD